MPDGYCVFLRYAVRYYTQVSMEYKICTRTVLSLKSVTATHAY